MQGTRCKTRVCKNSNARLVCTIASLLDDAGIARLLSCKTESHHLEMAGHRSQKCQLHKDELGLNTEMRYMSVACYPSRVTRSNKRQHTNDSGGAIAIYLISKIFTIKRAQLLRRSQRMVLGHGFDAAPRHSLKNVAVCTSSRFKSLSTMGVETAFGTVHCVWCKTEVV